MYIRVQENSIRYRVSREEAQTLLSGENLSSSIMLSSNFSLSYEISCSEFESSFNFQNDNTLSLIVNHTALTKEITERPSKTGLEIPNENSNISLTVTLEVDLKRKRS